MATLEEIVIEDELEKELVASSTEDIINRTRLLDNDIKVSHPALPAVLIHLGHAIRDSAAQS